MITQKDVHNAISKTPICIKKYIHCMINRIKNFQTRRQLKDENEKLKERIKALEFRPPIIQCERRSVREIKASHLSEGQDPEQFVKDEIAYEMFREIKQHIRYEISNEWNGKKIHTGILEIVIKN